MVDDVRGLVMVTITIDHTNEVVEIQRGTGTTATISRFNVRARHATATLQMVLAEVLAAIDGEQYQLSVQDEQGTRAIAAWSNLPIPRGVEA